MLILKNYGSIARNRVKSRLQNEKSEYYQKKFNESYNDVKQVWKTTYQLLGHSRELSPKQIFYNGSLISSPSQMAEAFNDIFIAKVQKVKTEIAEDANLSPVHRLSQWLNKRGKPIPTLEFKAITVVDLRRYIKKLKGGRSSGVDDIDSFSLKLAAPIIEEVLLHLVNLTITNGIFANCWKNSSSILTTKKGTSL